jgi:hypothetical protein
VDKVAVVSEIRRFADLWFAEHKPHVPKSAACFYWAVLTAAVLKDKGIDIRIQAGSLQWPRVKHDDGKIATHFSYMWEPESPATIEAILENRFPELHVWVALPERRELVDVTTRYLKQQCEERAGMKWLAPKPPDFLWCSFDRMPKGVIYKPELSAIHYVLKIIRETWNF